ncbi:MAG: hypothetical protein GX557_09515, partial [Chloroflexi bacterium]|nr:hypothetical protein [Chloroflexota bacterium]
GNLLIDRWYGGERSTTVKQQIWRGWHEVVIEYFELEGIARARFTWSRIMPTPTPTLTNQQWVAEYYDNAKLSGQPVIVRNEPEIKFDWALRSPDKLIPVDRFSARFTHKLQFAPGTYELSLVVDDGARLYVDDKLVIDAWQTGIRRELTAQVELSGEHRVRIEYFENGEGAALFFGWKRVASGAGPANKVPVGAQAPEHTPAPKQR